MHITAYYDHATLALFNCQHHGHDIGHSNANPLNLPGLPVQTNVLKPNPAVLICLGPYPLPSRPNYLVCSAVLHTPTNMNILLRSHVKSADLLISILWLLNTEHCP